MIKIGITGGIGSGKTVVCSLIEKMGYPVFNADEESKQLCNTYEPLKQKLISSFGNIYTPQGELNKPFFASIIFNNPEKLALANSIIHPELIHYFEKWADNQKSKLVFIESAILLESIFVSAIDNIVCVTAPENVRIERVMQQRNIPSKNIRERIKNQLSEAEQIRKADFLIDNGGKKLVIPQIEIMLEKLNALN